MRELGYESDQLSPVLLWSYIGPGGNTLNGVNPTTGAPLFTTTGDWSAHTSPIIFDLGQTGANFTSLTGAGAPRFSPRDDIADLFRTNPEHFVNAAPTANYETANYLNHRDYLETITAVYSMFNTKVGKWRFQGGVRYELTEKESKEFDPLRNSAVAAAGFPVALAWTSGMRPATPP